MKKLIIYSLFALVLFSCKKKDEVAPPVPTYSLRVNISDTGPKIDENNINQVAICKSEADWYGKTTAISSKVTYTKVVDFDNITYSVVYVFASGAYEETKAPVMVDLTKTKEITVEFPL